MIWYQILSSKHNFIFQLNWNELIIFINTNIYDFRTVFILISYLQKNNIPHNIYITRALNKELNTSDLDDTRNCVRVFVWARAPSGKLCIIHILNACWICLK